MEFKKKRVTFNIMLTQSESGEPGYALVDSHTGQPVGYFESLSVATLMRWAPEMKMALDFLKENLEQSSMTSEEMLIILDSLYAFIQRDEARLSGFGAK